MKRAHAYRCTGSRREVEVLARSATCVCRECGAVVRLVPVPGERFRRVAMHAAPAVAS